MKKLPTSKSVKTVFADNEPHPMSIRFSAEERKMIDRAAGRDGLKFGSWVRQIAVLSAKCGMGVSRTVEMKRVYDKTA